MSVLNEIISRLQNERRLNCKFEVEFSSTKKKYPEFTGLTSDPWEVKPGYIYCTIEEEEFPNHFHGKSSADYAALAIENGALAFISSYDGPRHPQLNILTDNLNRFIGFFAAEFYEQPFNGIKIIGVTGTKGKTSSSQLVDAVLAQHAGPVGIIGTIGVYFPNHFQEPGPLSNPPALELFKLGVEFKRQKTKVLIMEVTSHGAVFERNSALEFSILILTNMTSDHLDFHETLLNYHAAKKLYFERLFTQSNSATAIINADDLEFSSVAAMFQANAPQNIKLISYSIANADADLKAQVLTHSNKVTEFRVEYCGKILGEINLQIPGLFNVSNSLSAIASGIMLGVKWSDIKKGLELKSKIPGRFERVENEIGINIIVDYAHTEDSLFNIITNLRSLNSGRLITVFGCGGNRDITKRPRMGMVAAANSDIVVLTSDNPRFEDPTEIIEHILSGVLPEDFSKVISEVDRRRAIAKALALANRGDTLLVAGRGHEKFQIIGADYVPFVDVLVIREELNNIKGRND